MDPLIIPMILVWEFWYAHLKDSGNHFPSTLLFLITKFVSEAITWNDIQLYNMQIDDIKCFFHGFVKMDSVEKFVMIYGSL